MSLPIRPHFGGKVPAGAFVPRRRADSPAPGAPKVSYAGCRPSAAWQPRSSGTGLRIRVRVWSRSNTERQVVARQCGLPFVFSLPRRAAARGYAGRNTNTGHGVVWPLSFAVGHRKTTTMLSGHSEITSIQGYCAAYGTAAPVILDGLLEGAARPMKDTLSGDTTASQPALRRITGSL